MFASILTVMHTPSVALGASTPGTGRSATPGPAPAAALKAPSPCTLERAPRPGKELEMVFNEETGQTALIRAGHGQTSAVTSRLLTCNWPFLSPYPSAFHDCSSPNHLNRSLSLPLVPPLDI